MVSMSPALAAGLPQTPSPRWHVDHKKVPQAGRRSLAAGWPPPLPPPRPSEVRSPETPDVDALSIPREHGQAKERRHCRRSAGSRRHWLANACRTLCCTRNGRARDGGSGRGSGLRRCCSGRAGPEALETGSGAERLRRGGDLVGVQGARKFVCRCAGEPKRCLKDCVNSGLEDEARVSHKEWEHAVMGVGSAQLPVRS